LVDHLRRPDPRRNTRMDSTPRAGQAPGLSRRSVLGAALALPVAAAVAPAIPAHAAQTDWGKAVVDSTIKRFTPTTLGGWGYTTGLHLYGQYLVYRRTGTSSYFDYIVAWMDRFVSADG